MIFPWQLHPFCYRHRNGSGHLTSNNTRCTDCQVLFERTTGTPIVNCHTLDFHLSLYAGPTQLTVDGRVYRTGCVFQYARHDPGPYKQPREHWLSVAIVNVEENAAKTLTQVEAIADKLAEMLESEQTLADAYTFKAGQLTPGLPK